MENIIPMYQQMKESAGEVELYQIFTQYQVASQDHMWYKTGITEEELNMSIEMFHLADDPEFKEKVRRNQIAIMNA